ncbi:hypothetical protein SAMN05443245_5614 [Paraburkholderia fungorum]|uniref:Uncharacterized protein n=1 Tax=Paraburkholderia fungorum TaxID=134537 RepID=A0A1H1ISX0_9BURK|nr:hypothetical protein SAMN05443245_5614 [Paraburkholderia fungorum]
MVRRIAVVADQLDTDGPINPYKVPICAFGYSASIGGHVYCEPCKSVGTSDANRLMIYLGHKEG